MSIFSPSSRYTRFAQVRRATDRKGANVYWVTPAQIPRQTPLGEHRAKQGQRLDRLAAHYLDDPTGYWKIAEANDAMSADAIADKPLITIPRKDG